MNLIETEYIKFKIKKFGTNNFFSQETLITIKINTMGHFSVLITLFSVEILKWELAR